MDAPKLTCTKGRHFGRLGLRTSRRLASAGVRLALRVLHGMHEHTMFSQVVGPPRSLGITWSRFRSRRSNTFPQYWQVFWSRSKRLCRVNLTSFLGNRSKPISRITRGTRMRKDTVPTDASPSGSEAERSRHCWKSRVR